MVTFICGITIKIGIKVTVFRFWVIDNKYHLVVFEGNLARSQASHPR